MNDTVIDYAARNRAPDVVEAKRAKLKSTRLERVKALAGSALLLVTVCAEVVSAKLALNLVYPTTSAGESLADGFAGLPYTLAAYFVLGHLVISSFSGRLATGVNWMLNGLAATAIVVMLLGMGLFSLSGTLLTVEESGDASAMLDMLAAIPSIALGAVFSCLLIISFNAAHVLMRKLLTKLDMIFSAHDAREEVTDLDREISTTDALSAQIENERRAIDTIAAPGALVRKVASEMARIVGNVTSRAHGAVTARRAFEGVDLNDSDEVPEHLRDIPLPLLEQVLADLKQYTLVYFASLLKKEY